MNVKLYITLLFCLFGLGLFAQQDKVKNERRKENFEKFQAKRMEYIASQMNLTSEESTVFWPLCNELQTKKFELNRALRKEIREIYQAEKEGRKPAMENYERAVNMSIDIKMKEAELDKVYTKKFKEIISVEKILKYQRAEQHFAREMFAGFDGNKDRTERDRTEGGRTSKSLRKSTKLQLK